jgi:hypothetical protein
MTLWGNPETGMTVPGTILDSGQRQFPFQIQIPQNIPASFEYSGSMFQSTEASIRYKIKVYLDIPMGLDVVVKKPIQMFCVVPPEMRQKYDASRSVETSKTVCCLCLSQGDIQTKLDCPDTVWYANVPRPLVGTIKTDNHSSRNCTTTKISVVQMITLSARHRYFILLCLVLEIYFHEP